MFLGAQEQGGPAALWRETFCVTHSITLPSPWTYVTTLAAVAEIEVAFCCVAVVGGITMAISQPL